MPAGLALSRRHLLVLSVSIALAAVSLALASPASAQLTFGSFATEGDARAGWIEEPNSPQGSTEQQSIGLFVNGTSADDFSDAARAIFTGVTGVPPATPPSFDFKVFTVGGSGGSVRLVVRFSDGGRGELRPVSFESGAWTHVDGAGANWDNRGGSCGDRASATYDQVVACHPGAEVTVVEVINDSGWLFLGGFQALVDNVSFGGTTVSAPPPPVLGESVHLAQLTGAVVVRYPGRGRKGRVARLRGKAPLPVGTVVDSRRGRVRLVSSLGGKRRQAGRFRSGVFQVRQSARRRGLTELVLRGGLAGCRGHAAADGSARAATHLRSRRLWGSGRGRYRTRGRYSSGSVRGTKWLTVDTCAGTLTVVVEGVVVVRDFTTGETITLRAGDRYFATQAR
ncbi:MAG TPA: hypothetical protein VFM57_16875 [Thermoleophilaceae bacterium]|nr:hypothetical protein [Thermoleophilaceae bacterium]